MSTQIHETAADLDRSLRRSSSLFGLFCALYFLVMGILACGDGHCMGSRGCADEIPDESGAYDVDDMGRSGGLPMIREDLASPPDLAPLDLSDPDPAPARDPSCAPCRQDHTPAWAACVASLCVERAGGALCCSQ